MLIRPLKKTDIDFLFLIENDPVYMEFGTPHTPFSKNLLKNFIDHSAVSLLESGQFRYVLEDEHHLVGFLDLFDFEKASFTASVGILVTLPFRRKLLAYKALQKLELMAATQWGLKYLLANVATDNEPSLQLFEKLKYKKIDIKNDFRLGNKTKSIVIFKKNIQ